MAGQYHEIGGRESSYDEKAEDDTHRLREEGEYHTRFEVEHGAFGEVGRENARAVPANCESDDLKECKRIVR